MRITYDAGGDSVYLAVWPLPPGKVQTRELGPGLFGDYSADGKFAGIEILDASTLADGNLTRLVSEIFRPVEEASGAARGPRTNSKRRGRKSPVPAAAA